MKKYTYWFLISAILFPLISPAQVNEKIDRGVVALTVNSDKVYVGWRSLKEDPENVAFNVYRKDMGISDFEKVNPKPVTRSTNFLDSTTTGGHGYIYKIKTISNKIEKDSPGELMYLPWKVISLIIQ